MTITKKTRLLPPPFVGTRISIELDDPASLTWGIGALTLAEGHDVASIDWGDGQRDDIAMDGSVTHVYAQPGEYEVRISDDIATIRFSSKSGSDPFRGIYAQMIREFLTTARCLNSLTNYCFNYAAKLETIKCASSGLHVLLPLAIGNCSTLSGRLDLPEVTDISLNSFYGSTGLTELHFSAANEAIIKALPAWEESGGKFGAVNATVYFDL